jgi:hypothetical protein
MEAPSIFVAVPAYGGSIRTQCVHAIIDLLQHLWNRKIRAAYETIDNAEIAAARNFLASRFYYSGFSHLLFVDGDMVFSRSRRRAARRCGQAADRGRLSASA